MHVIALVYNVKAFRLGVGNAAALVAEHAPDVALIQECGPRHRLRRFADALGMEHASEHSLFRRSIHNAVLVRPPWRVLSKRLHRFPRDVRFYPRGALIVRMGRGGHGLWAVSVHLGLSPGARRRNAEELSSKIRPLNGAVVVGGDLNEGPTGRAVSVLSERFRDAWTHGGEEPGETFRADAPRSRIDYLFVNDLVAVERAVVLGGPEAAASSDHLPLLVDLTLSP